MTSTLLDIDLSLLEDMSFEIPCEEECDFAAKWSMLRDCCEETLLVCQAHKVQISTFIALCMMGEGGFMCQTCRGIITEEQVHWQRI